MLSSYHNAHDLSLGLLENGAGDAIFKNNEKYKAYKGDWTTFHRTKGGKIEYKLEKIDGKLNITRNQTNVDAIKQHCADYRAAAEQGYTDPWAPADPHNPAKQQYKWVQLPTVISHEISNKYFSGLAWDVVKMDKYLKAQWYRVIQNEYPAFICYPGGKLPIPIEVPYPTPTGQIIV